MTQKRKVFAPLLSALVLGANSPAVSAAVPSWPCACQDQDPAKKIEELVGQLGAEDISTRDKAAQELKKIGKPAQGALKKAAESADPEVKARARALLEWLKVLKLDDQGRLLVERDEKGWDVEYIRDEFGNVIKKVWVNPHDRKETLVRMYAYDVETRRLVEELDISGRKKLIVYGEDAKVAKTILPEGFVEEAEQVKTMRPAERKQAPGSTFKYDQGGKVIERKEEK